MPKNAVEYAQQVCDKMKPPLPSKPPSPEESRSKRQQIAERKKQVMESFLRIIGPRYRNATLDSYQAKALGQQAALKMLRAYADNLGAEIKSGNGILLFGSTGTGKDHLLIGVAKIAIAAGHHIQWVNGVDLQSRMREAIKKDDSEASVLAGYISAQILVLSDPLPPSGVLSDYQAATLYRIADYRYRHMLPTWVSLNVADANEAKARLGAAIVDRLRDGALAIECKWPSHRKAR